MNILKKIKYWALLILVFLLARQVVFEKITPDSALYHGLALNIIDGTGYVDNIRNDEILPTIGHPIILTFFKLIGDDTGEIFGKTIFVLILLFTFLIIEKLKINIFVNYLILYLVYNFIGVTSYGAVELSIALSVVLFWFGLINFLIEKDTKSSMLFSVLLFVGLLIRPVLMPLSY